MPQAARNLLCAGLVPLDATANALADSLDDDTLRSLSETELARLVAVLQQGALQSGELNVSAAGAEAAGTSPHTSVPPLTTTTAAGAISNLPGRAAEGRDDRRQQTHGNSPAAPGDGAFHHHTEAAAATPGAVAALSTVAVLCVAALLALVLHANDPCEQRIERDCGTLRSRLQATERERDALRVSFRAAVAEQNRLRLEAAAAARHMQGAASRHTNVGDDGQSQGFGRQLHISHIHDRRGSPSSVAASPGQGPERLPSTGPVTIVSPAPVPGPCFCPSSGDIELVHAQIRTLTRDNERLEAEPAQLQAAFQEQSEQIWRLRAQSQRCRTALRRRTANGASRRRQRLSPARTAIPGPAREAELLLRGELAACRAELRDAGEVRDQVRRLVGQ